MTAEKLEKIYELSLDAEYDLCAVKSDVLFVVDELRRLPIDKKSRNRLLSLYYALAGHVDVCLQEARDLRVKLMKYRYVSERHLSSPVFDDSAAALRFLRHAS